MFRHWSRFLMSFIQGSTSESRQCMVLAPTQDVVNGSSLSDGIQYTFQVQLVSNAFKWRRNRDIADDT